MYFKRIEMHGFKSFAEPVIIDFHPGVTCIVGPNGSGKSNISDAIRWALGEQSPKMLRGGKMEEVIFNGTASRKSRGMAEVTLVIDNSENILPIDYNEVAITRRMYRSGESEYLINNNQCRLRDIRELIMDTGIGVDGYSLIGQGKIQNIIDGKADERREIFEESAGVVMYKTKKQEAERKLANANINLDRVNDIIGEIEDRIGSLEDESIKAKEALVLREKKRELDINITLRNIEKFNDSNESGADDISKLSKDINRLTVDRNTLEVKIQEARDRSEALLQLGNEAREKLLDKVNEINRMTNENQLSDEKMAGFERDLGRLGREIEALNAKLEKEITASYENEKKKEELSVGIEKSSLELAERIDEYNKLLKSSLEHQSAIDENKNMILGISNKVSSLRSEAASVRGLKESLLKRKEEVIAEAEELASSSGAVYAEIAKAEKEKDETERRISEKTEKKFSAIKHKNKLSKELKELFTRGEELRIKSSQALSRKTTIEEMEANYEGYNGAVKFIMKSNLRGISGVVAELINVPKGYEVAIETALGGSLQNIVCEKDEDAKKAINLLKDTKSGRLTFLPIESIRGKKINLDKTISGARGFEGLASDIVSFEKKYGGIAEYLLGRVVIVDHIDTAIRLSKNVGSGIRFVTLDGEVINASGAITGGKYKNQTADLLARKNEISKLEEKLTAFEKSLKETKDAISEKEALKSGLEKEIEVLESGLSELMLREANIQAKIITLNETGRNAQEANEKRDRELDAIENDYRNADKLIEELNLKADGLDEQIKALEEDSLKEMELLEDIQAKISLSNEAITEARVKKTEIDNKLDSLETLLEISQDNIDEFTEQIDSKVEDKERIEGYRDKLMFGSGDSIEVYNNLCSEKQELEEYIEHVDKDRAGVISEISENKLEFDRITEEYNSYADQKQQQEIRFARNEAQLEAAKQKLIEDFEINYAQALELKKEDFVYSSAVKESREIKNRLEELGEINVGAIDEFDRVSERYGFLKEQRKDITDAMDELNDIISDMDINIKSRFKKNFNEIVVNFEEIFRELFGGGTAELRLEDEDNPLESRIDIIAQPPGKKLQNINLLSGGEKSMTAIALMFAVLKTKPTPFCILDEVEAALDDANIDRFARYLKKFNDIQFAVVTHQKATMEYADVLYGVTMPEQGISKVLSLKLGDEFEI